MVACLQETHMDKEAADKEAVELYRHGYKSSWGHGSTAPETGGVKGGVCMISGGIMVDYSAKCAGKAWGLAGKGMEQDGDMVFGIVHFIKLKVLVVNAYMDSSVGFAGGNVGKLARIAGAGELLQDAVLGCGRLEHDT